LAVNVLDLRCQDLRATETRRRIVETSLLLFAEQGYRGVSVRDRSSPAWTSAVPRT